MKLRNKKTGVIKNFALVATNDSANDVTLAQVNEEWEDYEDDDLTKIINWIDKGLEDEILPVSVNDFVEKLKAWKRLKSCRFKFKGWRTTDLGVDKYYFVITGESDGAGKGDLDLLFGGEE